MNYTALSLNANGNISLHVSGQDISPTLNNFGSEGWELAATDRVWIGEAPHTVYIFKRRV